MRNPSSRAFPKKSISLFKKFRFVAERRLSLARRLKAGIEGASQVTSRQRRMSDVSAVADATMFGVAMLIPALKRPG
jgi:hypothetical protein